MSAARALAILWSCLFVTSAACADLTEEQQEIFRKVRGYNELITKATHDRFWSLFSEPERQAVKDGASSTTTYHLLMMRAQAALARSMYETRQEGATVRTAELVAVRDKMLSNASNDNQRKVLLERFTEEDRRLDPAWFQSVDNRWSDPTALFLRWNHAEVPARRSEMLLNPVYDDTPRPWIYPPMRLTLNWPYPWWANYGGFCRNCVQWHLEQRIGETALMGVHFYGDVAHEKPPEQLVRMAAGVDPVATDVWTSYEIVTHTVEAGDWRGFRSARYTFVLDFALKATQRDYRVSRIVLDPEHKAAWLIVAVSTVSPEEAEAVFSRLEGAIMLQ